MAFQFITLGVERQGSKSPSTAGFGIDGGRASMRILVDEVDLDGSIKECLGSAVPDGKGGIARVLPLAHPQYPWLFCERISNIEGMSFVDKFPSETDLQLEAKPLPFYAYYTKYELSLDFAPRPYAVLEDNSIGNEPTANFLEPDGAVLNPIAPIVVVQREWLRFCEWDYIPAGDYLTAQQGQFIFKIDPVAGVKNPMSDKGAGNGQIRLMQPNSTIKYRWHQVPFSYIESSNSHFLKAIGKINQKKWLSFEAGTLLFTGVSVLSKFTPPFPDFVKFAGVSVPSQQKLCNLEFTFIFKNYKPGSTYTKENLTDSNNDIVFGHNLLPNAIDRKYYYAKTKGTVIGMPIYPSFPFQLMFRDPDA